jgi:HEPN domain
LAPRTGGEARWDSDADVLVVMPFEGQPQDTVKGMRNTCEPAFPLDLHLRRPEEIAPRYRWGDPFIREALNHGVMLHGEGRPDALCPGDGGSMSNAKATPGARVHTPTRNPVVNEWIARAERHWRMAEQMADLTVSYQSGLFLAQLCLETYLRAALIAQGVDSRKCWDLQISLAWSSAKTALAESIRCRWRAMPITAAAVANLMPKASATARPARSSISSRVWGPLIRARRMLAASPSSRSGRAGSLESTATALSQPEAIAAR